MKINIDKLNYLQNVMKSKCQQLPLRMTAVELPAKIAGFEFTDMNCDTLAISAFNAAEKKNKSRYYVIYDHNGEAIIGLKVSKKKLFFAYEQNEMSLRPLYLHIVKMFLEMNKFTIPTIGVDGAYGGLLKQRGKVYNIWELPPNFVIRGDVELVAYSHGPHRKYLTRLPYMNGVTVTGTFNCSFNNLKNLVGCPKAKRIISDFNPLSKNSKTR